MFPWLLLCRIMFPFQQGHASEACSCMAQSALSPGDFSRSSKFQQTRHPKSVGKGCKQNCRTIYLQSWMRLFQHPKTWTKFNGMFETMKSDSWRFSLWSHTLHWFFSLILDQSLPQQKETVQSSLRTAHHWIMCMILRGPFFALSFSWKRSKNSSTVSKLCLWKSNNVH